jgi:CRP/FNR family transcriptional regulator, cyclic AMP receptor protein
MAMARFARDGRSALRGGDGLGPPPRRGDLLIRLLSADPDLGARLDDHRFGAAEAHLLARVHSVDVGTWLPGPPGRTGGAGLLMLDGFVSHAVTVGRRHGTELLGQGDVLQRWIPVPEDTTVSVGDHWRVLEPTRFAVLDFDFLAAAVPYPEVLVEVIGRTARRARRLAVQGAISEIHGMPARVLMLLWHLAEAWGRRGPDGYLLRLPISHDAIGQMIGAHRSSVTTAITALVRSGDVVAGRNSWLLRAPPPNEIPPSDHADAPLLAGADAAPLHA